MSSLLRKLVLTAVVSVGLATSAAARDWTIGSDRHRVGFIDLSGLTVGSRDPSTSEPLTIVCYGFGTVWVPLLFWATVSTAGAIPILGAALAFLIVSRLSNKRCDEPTCGKLVD